MRKEFSSWDILTKIEGRYRCQGDYVTDVMILVMRGSIMYRFITACVDIDVIIKLSINGEYLLEPSAW
jgi:hypothetical protein